MCMQNKTLVAKIEERAKYKDQIDALEFKVNAITDELKNDLAARETEKYEFELDGVKHTISNSTYEKDYFDAKAFKEAYPDLYAKFTTKKPQSRFSCK